MSTQNFPPDPITEDMIAEAAFYIWQEEGQPHGREEAHWLSAIERLKATAPQPKPVNAQLPQADAAAKSAATSATRKSATKKAAARKAAPKTAAKAATDAPVEKKPTAKTASKRKSRAKTV